MVSEQETTRHQLFWARAYEHFHARLNSYARKLTHDKSYDAEDLVQEAICRALMYPKDPREVKNPLGYLMRTVRNIWIDKWARENTANLESLDTLANSTYLPSVEPDVLRMLENEELQRAISVKQGPLTRREQLLLKLHLEGYTCGEIADKLKEDVRAIGCDLNAVRSKVRYRLTKANLRR